MSGSSFTNVFGGAAVRPAQPSFLAYALAANTALVWPLESTEGTPSVAAMINVTPASAGLSLAMPPGDTGSVGVQSLIANVGAFDFTLTDEAGNQIAIIATTQSWLVALTDNSTDTGTWSALQLASTTSNATAGSLAGAGLSASGTLLETEWVTSTLSANAVITASYRSTNVVWKGATGALQLDTSVNLTPGWFCAFSNNGTGPVTITGSSGETINGGSSIVLQVGNSGFIICAAGAFYSLGALPGPLNVVNGGTGATTTVAALTNLGGTTIGQSIFTAPSASAIVSLLGLTASLLTESTIATNQTLAANASGTAYACTAALTLTLPLTTTLTPSFLIAVAAVGAAVTLTPQATDGFIGGADVGASYVLPVGTSAMFLTDAAGTWIPIFAALPLAGGAISGNLSVGGTLAVTGTTALTGTVTGSAGFVASGSDAGDAHFRAVGGAYGVFLRNDGTNAYLMQTAPNAPLGVWNNFRPFSWLLSTGAVTIDGTGVGTTFGGKITAGVISGTNYMGNNLHTFNYGWNGKILAYVDGSYQRSIAPDGGTDSINISGVSAGAPWSGISGIPAICYNNGGTYGINITGTAANASAVNGGGTFTGTVSSGVTINGPSYQGNNGHTFNFQWVAPNLGVYIDGTGVGILTPSSDYRLKHSIADATAGALDTVKQLRPVTYRFGDVGVFTDDGMERLGFLAHEVQAILPSAAHGEKDAVDEEGRIMAQSLVPMPLIALLTKALQEAEARIAALEARLDR